MDVVIRAPLFYLMDVWFNKLTAADQQQNSTMLHVGNSTMENKATFLATGTQNSTLKMEATEAPFYNSDYLLNWPLTFIFNISIILMVMFALSSHLKNLVPVLLHFSPLIIITWSVNYYFQGSLIILHLNVYYVVFIRCIIFGSLCSFLLYQMHQEQRSHKMLGVLAVPIFFLLVTINPTDVQFQLAKYLLYVYLLPASQLPSRVESAVQTALLFILFLIIHLAPFYLKTEDESLMAWKMAFCEQGISVAFVVVGIFVLVLFTLCVEVTVSYFLYRRISFGRLTWISPVYFYAFLVEKQLRITDGSDVWAALQIHVVTHLLATLINVCDVTASGRRTAEEELEAEEVSRMKKRARMLYLFTIFSAICCLVFAGLVSISSPEMIVITVYVVFTSLFNVFYYLRFDDYPDYQQIDNAFRLPLLTFTSVYMLVQVILVFDLLLLIGSFSFALLVKVHAQKASPYFSRLRRVAQFVKSIPKMSAEKLRALEEEDAACCICLEKTSAGCETKFEHCYHEGYLKKWLNVNDKCPICQRNLFKVDSANVELEEVVQA